MRYFYIICLALSSIFTYKHLVAQEQARQYAFFVPDNVFMQNTAVDDIEKNPIGRRPIISEDGKLHPEITLPYVRKKAKLVPPEDWPEEEIVYEKPKIEELEPMQTSQQIIDDPEGGLLPGVQERLSQYSLGDQLSEEETANKTEEYNVLSSEKDYAQLSIEEMLEKIPFPDVSLPKYKQAYANYGMDLRVLYRRGNLPLNYEQDDALAKADTIQRFKVE